MGSCCSSLNRDSVPDNHPTKFKVTNVDDEGVELDSGVMELTQSQLVLHLQLWNSVHWPYISLRRYGYDSNLFCFESGLRCQTGQGIFAFKCSRAKEIFNLLQDWMQRNSINVMKEAVIVTRNSQPPQLDLPQGPLQPTALGYTISSFCNRFPGCPVQGLRFSAPRRPATSSLRHPSLVEESTRALIASDEQSHTYVNVPTGEEDHRRSRHCLQPLPESRAPFPAKPRGPSQWDPQVFLQPRRVKFMPGPTPARQQVMRCQSLCPSLHDPPHNNNNEGPSECPAQPKRTYENVGGCENVSGLRRGPGWRLSPEEPGRSGLAQRQATLPHYRNLPSLPPVWESQVQQLGGEDGDDGDSRDGLTHSFNRFPDGGEDKMPLQKPTSTCAISRSHGAFPVPLALGRGSPIVPSFEFRRPCPEPPRQLNYIQVELKGWGTDRPKGPQNCTVSGATWPTRARSSESYAVFNLRRTVSLSDLQRSLPHDDGPVRKTRPDSTDLPL